MSPLLFRRDWDPQNWSLAHVLQVAGDGFQGNDLVDGSEIRRENPPEMVLKPCK